MWSIIRRILHIDDKISSEMAKEIVERHCQSQGWPFEDPVLVSHSLLKIRIMTNTHYTGGNVFASIDVRSGEITYSSYTNR